MRERGKTPYKISMLSVLHAALGMAFSPANTSASMRVAAALLRHLNRKTGRCDPSIGTLVRATGRSRSTVLRALDKLCDREKGCFERIVHGGRNGRNSYILRQELLERYVEDYDRSAGIRKSEKEGQSQPEKPAPSHRSTPDRSQQVAPKPIQSTRRNKPDRNRRNGQEEQSFPTENVPTIRNPHSREMSASSGQRSPARREVQQDRAEQRLQEAIQATGEHHLYTVDIDRPGAWIDAVEAEARRPGAGLEHLRRLQRNG